MGRPLHRFEWQRCDQLLGKQVSYVQFQFLLHVFLICRLKAKEKVFQKKELPQYFSYQVQKEEHLYL